MKMLKQLILKQERVVIIIDEVKKRDIPKRHFTNLNNQENNTIKPTRLIFYLSARKKPPPRRPISKKGNEQRGESNTRTERVKN